MVSNRCQSTRPQVNSFLRVRVSVRARSDLLASWLADSSNLLLQALVLYNLLRKKTNIGHRLCMGCVQVLLQPRSQHLATPVQSLSRPHSTTHSSVSTTDDSPFHFNIGHWPGFSAGCNTVIINININTPHCIRWLLRRQNSIPPLYWQFIWGQLTRL